MIETLTEALGVTYKHSSRITQTCGKIERFHQTEKKFLTKQPAAGTLAELQAQLDRFVENYNHHRPTARSAGAPLPMPTRRSRPTRRNDARDPLPRPARQSRQTRITDASLRVQLHHIGMGARRRGQPVVMLIVDRDIRIVSPDGELLRHLTLDPTATTSRKPTAGSLR